MSAKLLHNLSDENPNLNKQYGCMNGIFQVFYRQQYPARPVSSNVEKSLPPGEREDRVGEINMKKEKSRVKEKHRVSSESSSRPSFSSSPRSSSFSSAEVSTTTSQLDQPGEKLIRKQPNAGSVMPFDLKELVKGSINRDTRTRREETSAFKLKETPRLSLDSRSSPPPQEHVTVSHRRSTSSVVAKLMGLAVTADDFEAQQRKEINLFCDSPRPPSRVEPTALHRSRSFDSIKKIPPSKFPMELAPWKQMKAGTAAPTVYGEIQKRITQLEFKKAGKDLRALKQILEAMEKTQPLQRTHQPVPAATSPAMNFKPSLIVVMKPVDPVCTSSLHQKPALPNINVPNSKQTRKVPGHYKGQQNSTKSQKKSVSPRMQPKKLGFERQSRPTTPKSEAGKAQRQLGRQQTDSVSPRRKQGRTSLQQPDDRVSNASSDLRSSTSDSNISLGSNADIEVTSKHRLERNCGFPELHTPKRDRPSLKPLKVTVEQPSPVSVLDAAFEEEESPSPVRKISLTSTGEDALRSEESMWINKPTGVCRSILLPENKGPTQPDSDLLECFPDEDGNYHKYISEILLASGLLRDLEYSKISIQLNKARLPINPGLFFFLEQNKDSNATLLHNRGRGFRQQQTNLTEKIRRKLIFDTVNEILSQRFTAEGFTKPRFTTNPVTTMEQKSKGEELLHTLCSEIDRLQENKSKCILEDGEEDIIWEDLQCQGMNLKEFEGENPWIVLDIERMIFRDLVSEVCFC